MKNITVLFTRITVFLIILITQNGYSQDIAPPIKQILILHTVEESRPWSILFNESFKHALSINANISIEYLDLIRCNSQAYKDILEKLILSKYQNNPPDIIVVTQIEGVEFVYNREIFPEIPKILVGIEDDVSTKYSNSTTVSIGCNFDAKIRHAHSIFPQTKKIFVVAGTNDNDTYVLNNFKTETYSYREKISFLYLTNLDKMAILDSVRNLPENSIVYLLPYTQQLNGEAIMARDFSINLAKNSSRPVFTFIDLLAEDTGIFGGMVSSLRMTAEKTVDIIIQIYNGQNIQKILPAETAESYIYNWNELKKWNVDIEKLPKESIIYNRSYTFFELYKTEVVISFILLSLYTLLLILLLYSNRKRKKSERDLLLHFNELQKAKEKVDENEKKFELIAEYTYDWETYYDNNLNIVFINQAFEKITGYNKDDFKSKKLTLKEIVFNEDIDNVQTIYTKIFDGESINSADFRIIHKNGQVVFVEVCSNAIFNINKDLIGIRTSVRDITKRKLAEIELHKAKFKAEESDRLKSAFLANMSHEIRTPMNGILGFSNLLSEPGLETDKQQAYIKIIRKSSDRMLNILNEIVEISKIESGAIVLHTKQVNINKKLELVYKLLKPEAKLKSINLSLKNSLQLTEPILNTDEGKLYSILTNLIKNAIKYTDKGSIEFGYNPKVIDGRDFLEFYVKDTGVGIRKDRQDAIFERFIQADIEDVEARQGAGLGLTIVKSYVELLGGNVWVESEKGIGSTFYFTLPYN